MKDVSNEQNENNSKMFSSGRSLDIIQCILVDVVKVRPYHAGRLKNLIRI